jgi:thiol-disulfide isomerase/thioredoxin
MGGSDTRLEGGMNFKAILAAAALGLIAAGGAGAQSVSGLWDAQVTVDGAVIPFQLSLAQIPAGVKSNFFDGDRAVNPSSRGSFKDGDLALAYDSYATVLKAHLDKGVLTGTYGGARYSYPFEAKPHRAEPAAKGAPSLAGVWEVPVDAKNEKAWRLNIRQAGPRLYATILRIDGDTGTMSGAWRGGAFHLSHFAGERPETMLVTPIPDGSLALVLTDNDGSTNRSLRAVRPAVARKEGSALPADAAQHTSVKDPNEPFHFAAKDLTTGKPVADTDARFKGKVVLVNIMGSWCPNCHDEAPFLAKLYDTYHARGLEIVALDFEYPDQIKDPQRAHAFIKRYGIKYTVLLAGELTDLHTVLPQAVNLHAWPTTFFLGRDGKVKSVHVGFTSAGSGPYDAKLKADVTREVEQMLAKKG